MLINFGLSDDYNWLLLHFIPPIVLSNIITSDMIDSLADYIDWNTISTKYIPGYVFVKYSNRINWELFLQNGHPKEIGYLVEVRDKLYEYKELFHITYMKILYYNSHFISAFPELIDWNWCAKYLQLTDYILLKNWNNFSILWLSKYQQFSDEIILEKQCEIKWVYAGKRPLNEKILRKVCFLIPWSITCQWQILSDTFITDHIQYIKQDTRNVELLIKHQKLTELFILKNKNWLYMNLVSQWQNLSYQFIKQNISILDITALQKNTYYNKPNTIQIIKNSDRYYIIDEPDLMIESNVIFCDISHILTK